jgi:ABC-2 type transport system permease protein
MSGAIGLIMGREFRTYSATASFWIALLIGPVTMLGATQLTHGAAPPAPITVLGPDPALNRSAVAALDEAAALEGRKFNIVSGKPAAGLLLSLSPDGALELRFDRGFPLSAAGRALVARSVESDAARQRLVALGAPSLVVRAIGGFAPSHDTGVLTRFALVMILWLVLVGSLGMLLQAVVRERANRALEMLLAAAEPWQIVAGKLLGVGAVSGLLLAIWLGSAALALPWAAPGSVAAAIFAGIATASSLARAVSIYSLAFAFYGLITIGIGAMARDSATAQTLSRPVFAVLLAAFFVALTAMSGREAGLDWLLYLPPFTPFMLLLSGAGQIPAMSQFAALGLMLAGIAIAGWLATGRITLSRQ